ncbi:hypothetical protein GO491_11775 [Flavobacteriaceae bacterium Ap0902]|nr:hypothetical protein [Flavobacteriaceae bacterium Ap0902]
MKRTDLIIDIQSILNHVIGDLSYEDLPISFSWGDQLELLQWIKTKDSEIAALRAISVNANKYPLVWLTPTKIRHSETGLKSNITLIFAQITEPEWLNETRWDRTMPFLSEVANHVLKTIDTSKHFQISRRDGYEIEYEYMPNYSTTQGKSNEALDIWDAIVVNFELLIKLNCLSEIQSSSTAK